MNILNLDAAAQQHAAGFGMPLGGHVAVAPAAAVSADRRVLIDPSTPQIVRERCDVKAELGLSTGYVGIDATGFAGTSAWSPPT